MAKNEEMKEYTIYVLDPTVTIDLSIHDISINNIAYCLII